MSSAQTDPPEWKQHVRDKGDEEKLLDRFRDPADPLKFVIVTRPKIAFLRPVRFVNHHDDV